MFLLFMKMCRVPEYDFQQVQSEICRRASRAWEEKQLTKDDILNTCSVKDDSLANRLDIAENLAPLLARSSAIQGNPRIVKRMLNTLSMRTDLAHRRGIPIDERLLAKLVTFERCTDNRAYQELVQIIGNAPNGAPEKLKELEDAASSGKLSKESLPNDWNTFHEFIEEWLVLPPSLVDRDLRPALYLSRETAPIVTPAGEMSRHSVKALATLRQVTSINSEAGKSAVKGLTLNDAHGVMDRLISDLRAQERIEISTPFAGAILLANHYAQTQEALRSFLNSLPQGSISAGNMQRLKGLTWAESLRSRSKSPNNS
jgi:predicted KAP-like P-loop ATPase